METVPQQRNQDQSPAPSIPQEAPQGKKTPPSGQKYYVATIPAEIPEKHPGRIQGMLAIICAVISLLLFPPIFGTVGIILGAMAYKKGAKTLGLVGITLSAIFLVLGMLIGIGVYYLAGSAKGAVGALLFP